MQRARLAKNVPQDARVGEAEGAGSIGLWRRRFDIAVDNPLDGVEKGIAFGEGPGRYGEFAPWLKDSQHLAHSVPVETERT